MKLYDKSRLGHHTHHSLKKNKQVNNGYEEVHIQDNYGLI